MTNKTDWTDTIFIFFHIHIARKIKRGCDALTKPTYYLWQKDYPTDAEYSAAKEKYMRLGFRVVTYQDGQTEQDIHKGIKIMIQHHFGDISN